MANPRYFTWSRKPLVESIAQREKKNRSCRCRWTSFDLFASTSHHHDTSRCVQSYNLLSRPKCSDSRFLAANYKRKTRLKRRTKYQPCPCCIFKFSVSLIVIKNNMFWIKFVLKFSIYPDEIFFPVLPILLRIWVVLLTTEPANLFFIDKMHLYSSTQVSIVDFRGGPGRGHEGDTSPTTGFHCTKIWSEMYAFVLRPYAHLGDVYKPRGQNFGHFWPPLPPMWLLLVNSCY